MNYWKISVKSQRKEREWHMHNNRRITKKMEQYVPAAQIFERFSQESGIAFLDSSLVNELGQYSIIGRRPYEILKKENGQFFQNGTLRTDMTFEAYLKRYLQEHVDENELGIPMVSGAIGYFSYEYGREQMGVASAENDPCPIPEAVLTFYDLLIVEDCHEKEIYLSACGMTEDAQKLLARTEREILELLENGADANDLQKEARPSYEIKVTPNFEKEEYKQAVDRMIQYIREGDIYIANMTQRLEVESEKAPLDVFAALRKHNPSPFGGYLDCGTYQIVSASPERFLQMRNKKVQTRPIKGTRKRGATPEEDQALREELEQSGKDKSELLMIVDLERNDLNRVCRPGSVKVTELFTVEAYATVFHLVSNIEGELTEDRDVMDLIEAAFPGGSITGAPKYRAMEIIDELEHGKRGLYTGSIGYLTLDGACDFNIVIRTAVHKDGHYYLGVGGGITAESDLEFEYEETLQKAKAVLEALR